MIREGSRKLTAFLVATGANIGGIWAGVLDSDAFAAIQTAALYMLGAGNAGEHLSKALGNKWQR